MADKHHTQQSHLPSWLCPSRLRQTLACPTDALPLDLFRILVGLLAFAYFLRTLLEARDFSSPDGLIDHELSREIFWYTRINLFPANMSLAAFQTISEIACLCSLALIVGYRVRIVAVILYVIAVCTYRWNFLVMYVDDSIMHLMLFWMILLPVGRTLVLSEYFARRKDAWQKWKSTTVPGATLRLFFCNLALIYITAGLWKWTSPMWRDGTALFAVLKLPISHAPDFWEPQHLPLLMVFNYAALILEPLFPLLFILPRGHAGKYALLLGLLAFHLGSVATLQIPFANLACTATVVLMFKDELMTWIRGERAEAAAPSTPQTIAFTAVFALLVVTTLSLAMLSSAVLPRWRMPTRRDASVGLRSALAPVLEDSMNGSPEPDLKDEGLGPLQKSFFSALWCVGIAQQYQLFNWIDERNFSIRYHVIENEGIVSAHEVDAGEVLLPSTRGMALRLYLHGITWMRVPPQRQIDLRRSLHTRLARSYCQKLQPQGSVAIYATVERIMPGISRVEANRELMMRFRCQNDEPQMLAMNLEP